MNVNVPNDKKQAAVQSISDDFAQLSDLLEQARAVSIRIYETGKTLVPLIDKKALDTQKLLVSAGKMTSVITDAQVYENKLHIEAVKAAKKLGIDTPPMASVSGIQVTPMSGAR